MNTYTTGVASDVLRDCEDRIEAVEISCDLCHKSSMVAITFSPFSYAVVVIYGTKATRYICDINVIIGKHI